MKQELIPLKSAEIEPLLPESRHISMKATFASAAAAIADSVFCPVIVVGGFRSLDRMESILNQSKIEMVSLSRPLLREADLPGKMLADPGTISKCISCNRCYSSPAHKCIRV